MIKMKDATYEEFNKFLEKYPSKLEGSIIRFCEPPLLMLFDDSLGPRPGCAVAQVSVCCDHPYYMDKISDYVKKDDGVIESGWRVMCSEEVVK